MGVVFFCQSCGARFEVDARLAGKKGRCKKCGQHMEIPRAENLASMVSMRALGAVPAPASAAVRAEAVPAGRKPEAAETGRSLSSWLRSSASSVALAALTVDRMPIGLRKQKATPLDDDDDSKPYRVVPAEPRAWSGPASRAVGSAVGVWRRQMRSIQRVFRWLNNSAYLLSIPFVAILLLGIAMKSRNTAMFGATFVVLLNLGRIVAGAANLAIVPLSEGFNRKKMKKPFRRLLEPVLTIAGVLLAFTFVPWLSAGSASQADAASRLRTSAESLGEEMKGELRRTADQARDIDPAKIAADARERLKTVGSGPGGLPPTMPAPPPTGNARKPAR